MSRSKRRKMGGVARGAAHVQAQPIVVSPRMNLARAVKVALSAVAALSANTGHAELPVPCTSGCVNGPSTWVTSGNAGAVYQGQNLTINQTTPSAVMNWQSFNVGADNSVEFKQPDANSVALNRIFQADPSRILGRLTANGQVYLINQNGILFDRTAQVNVGGLVATSLNISQAALDRGIARAILDQAPAFEPFASGVSGDVTVEAGAVLRSSDQGRIFLLAPNVVNRGSIQTPNGQTVLAAGTKVYLAIDDKDPNLRGLVVEVDAPEVSDEELQQFLKGGSAGLSVGRLQNTGTINVGAGNATLAGLAVNQSGRISATTTVRANGSVYLRAADKPRDVETTVPRGTRGGLVTLGENSIIEILPDYADSTATVDVNEQPRSKVAIQGHTIHMLEDSRIVAPAGDVSFVAQANPSVAPGQLTSADNARNDSRVLLEEGAVIDVSGSEIELAADRLTVDVQLFSEQLRDSPLQRDGVLRGKEITVDLRRTGVREDGSTWVGTPLADVSGALDAVQRTVGERTLEGGTITMVSQGDVILSTGSVANVSGGRVDYAAGMLNTTKVEADGKVYDISEADPNRIYDGIVGQYTRKHSKWGVTETWLIPGADTSTFSPAYTQGYDAGRITINAAQAILDGTIDGSVSQGQYQRQPATMARGAELVLGYDGGSDVPINHRLPAVVFNDDVVLDALIASGFNARRDALPELDTVTLRPSLFGSDGVARAQVFSNEAITLPENTTLNLPAGGSLSLRADSIELAGNINIPSGTLTAVAERVATSAGNRGHDITVAGTARFDLRGQWVNDSPLLAPAAFAPVWIDGGSVSLASNEGDVVLASGSSIDVSGSGWLQANRTIRDGRGGSITLAARDNGSASAVQLDGDLNAFGLKRGGTLAVTTDAVCISSSVCSTDPESDVEWLTLAPQFFQEGGFASYSLASKRGDMVVAGDAQVLVQQSNFQLRDFYKDQVTGAKISTFSDVTLLPEHQRQAGQLTLASTLYTPVAPAQARIEQGAIVATDAGGAITVSSMGRLFVDGTLQASGGKVQLSLQKPEGNQGFFANEVLWLGSHAVLDASGDVVQQPNALGLRQGTILSGGTISLQAARGYVIAERGSSLDVSGTSTQLDIQGADGRYQLHSIGSNAGTINVSAAEGAVLEGSMLAHAGNAGALGGTIALTLRADTRRMDFPIERAYSTAARTIEIAAAPTESTLAGATYETFGAEFTSANNGRAQLDAGALSAGGFDSVQLTARNLRSIDPNTLTESVASNGVVRVSSSLDLARRLVIDAPSIEAAGDVTISAPYVAMGATDPNSPEFPTPQAGEHTLTIQGQWLDLIGSSTISGTRLARLQSENDLRLRAMPQLDSNTRELRGTLTTAGNIELQADQIYPTTLTDFTLSALGDASTIKVLPGSSAASPVLSAGGALRLQAANIEQGGVLRAPFGTIELTAQGTGDLQGTLTLLPGSVTSTSAAGQIIPVGRTEGGLDWVYDLGNAQKLVVSASLDHIPAQNIELTGRAVDLRPDAVLDVSASGDMQAYEFIPGVGGSNDVLSLERSGKSWAIVPTFGETLAPFDHQESAQFATRVGTTVHLDGSNGLPAGEYALLPARYALLPGAYLISERPEYADLPTGQSRTLLDGTTVIAGRFGVAGTAQIEDRTRGFAIVSGESLRNSASVHRPAEYNIALASTFFSAQSTLDAAQPRLPKDAGTVAIEAEQSLVLQATLRGQAATGGRGAAVDIAASELRIATDGDAATSDGVVPISAAALNRLGAESILLGGRRHTTSDGTQIDVISGNVTVASGVQLQAPELLLAAADTLTIESGAGVTGRGTAATARDSYVLQGNSALLRVAAGSQADVVRANSGTTSGAMIVASGALVAADGAALIDATANVSFEGSLQLDNADLAVGAAQINLGDVPADAVGFNLDQAQIAALSGSVEELRLRSRSDINVFGAPTLSAHGITLDAGGIVAREGSGMTSLIADTVTLTNTTGAAASTLPAATHGVLQVTAKDIELAEGSYTLGGFESVALSAQNTVMGRGTANLRVGGAGSTAANLAITAGAISGKRAAQVNIASAGRVDLFASGSAPTLPPEALGTQLRITGDSIHHNSGRIAVEGGRVELAALGSDGVNVGSGAVIDASGATRQFDTTQAFAPGGAITLRATSGNVSVAEGATLDVSGAVGTRGAGSDAGQIRVQASNGAIQLNGRLLGAAVQGQRQGRIELDGGTIDNLNTLNESLNRNGFTAERVLRIREGDVALTSNIVAQRIDVSADGRNGGGSISVAARLDARGDQGGTIRLAARNDVVIAGVGQVDVSATGAGKDGGTIELMSQVGGVQLQSGSSLNAAGGAAAGEAAAGRDGRVHVRVNRDVLMQVVNTPGAQSVAMNGAIEGAREIVIEGFKTYEDVDGVITSDQVQAFSAEAFTDAESFMLSADALAGALGKTGDGRFHIRPGVELRSSGDLTLNTSWDLVDWRFDGLVDVSSPNQSRVRESGYLTLRAGGDLNIRQDLSDGISANFFAFMDQPAQSSWSYRLTAGADLSGASPYALASAPAHGNVTLGMLGDPHVIRTGTGDIEINAAKDVKLADKASAIYTMGVPVQDLALDMRDFVLFQSLITAALVEHGGNITLRAGGNVIGQPTDQLVTDWLWRTAPLAGDGYPPPTMWGIEFGRFHQGIGALAGGDVTIVADGDVDNVSAAIPTNGVPFGSIGIEMGKEGYRNDVDIRGGGNLRVEAGGDIGGGVYYVGRGQGELRAGVDIRAGTNWVSQGVPLHTTLALGDGRFSLVAGRDVTVETVFNPTLIAPSQGQVSSVPIEWLNDFSTYGADSGVQLVSTGGDASLSGSVFELWQFAANGGSLFNQAERSTGFKALRVLPASLQVESLSGSIVTGREDAVNPEQFALLPSAAGTLELLAHDDVRFEQLGYLISDADPALVPTVSHPQRAVDDETSLTVINLLRTFGTYLHADIPVHSEEYARTVGYTGSRTPALILAQTGTVDMTDWNTSNRPVIWSGMPMKIIAGADIVNANAVIQNVEATDVSMIAAGRDITYPIRRDSQRRILPTSAAVAVDGPGQLVVSAGGDVDLKASPGLLTRGNTQNPALADEGAGIIALAGLGVGDPDYDGFFQRYLVDEDTYAASLLEYMKSRGGAASRSEAIERFRALPREQQIPFLTQVLWSELRTEGRKTVAEGTGDFSAGYAAIKALFPDIDPAKINNGDLNLFFSRIYTLDGGDISALVPSGIVNVGLATPPASFGISKQPSQLGIVAQRTGDVNILSGRDTLVNQSRVFAADGGSILIWSSAGNIDAGRGAKTAISAPPPVITFDPQTGQPSISFPPALAGSGIRAFVTTEGRKPGDVDLFAPTGVILVNDAGIGTAGNLTIGATQVIGAENIDVGGIAVGVPVDTGGLGASLASVSSTSSSASNAAAADTGDNGDKSTPIADTALSWLDVFVVGLGEDACKQDDIDCLKRQK